MQGIKVQAGTNLTFGDLLYPVFGLFCCLCLQNFSEVGKDELETSWLVCFTVFHFFNASEWKAPFHFHLQIKPNPNIHSVRYYGVWFT